MLRRASREDRVGRRLAGVERLVHGAEALLVAQDEVRAETECVGGGVLAKVEKHTCSRRCSHHAEHARAVPAREVLLGRDRQPNPELDLITHCHRVKESAA